MQITRLYDIGRSDRGDVSDVRLQKSRAKYDLRKYSFSNGVVDIWNKMLFCVILILSKCVLTSFVKTEMLFIILWLKFMEPKVGIACH